MLKILMKKRIIIIVISLITTMLLGFFMTNINAEQWKWSPVPLVSQDILDAGYKPGGEGCQWPYAICVDPKDGNLLFYGTDVGGIYRSTNGGKLWEPCSIGYSPRGGSYFAIDPNNINRVIVVACNSLEMDIHGLYLSTNMGETWESVLPKDNKGLGETREQVAFDKTSFDKRLGYSKVVYW